MGDSDKAAPQKEGPPKKSRHRKKHFYNTILQQMEFYFGDSNLAKDRFLAQLLSESAEIDIETFLKFNKIRKLNCTIDDIQKALSKSELIGLSEDGKKVHRKTPITTKENVDLCTIYVEHIRADATHENLIQIFTDFGKVVYVSIPKYKHNKGNKGFAFIEYETEDQAEAAIAYFDSIGCKIPTAKGPEELQSILTFEGNQQEDVEAEEVKKHLEEEGINDEKPSVVVEKASGTKRKLSSQEEIEIKKQKCTDEKSESEEAEKGGTSKRKLSSHVEASEDAENDSKKPKYAEEQSTKTEKPIEELKKKKPKKKDKRKNFFRELGMQVLSKKEWKRLRNQYLQLQRKKMKEFKQYLYKQKYGPKEFDSEATFAEEAPEPKQEPSKLIYTPGVIVKLKLLEPCNDVKKLKNDVKSSFPEAKYVDVPLPAGSEEVFIRFESAEAASLFASSDFEGAKVALDGEDEKAYWEKIEIDRAVKFKKTAKKQRGRDKLLKRAERESTKHMRFEDESLELHI